MRRARNAWRMGWTSIGLALAIVVASGISGAQSRGFSWFGPQPAPKLATATVRRVDFDVTLAAGGQIDSSDKTIVECELEAGLGMPWGSATILSIADEGIMVKKGDVLCTLDSARYEETLRLQEIHVGRVRAEVTTAKLNLEVAKLAVSEYREGVMTRTLQSLRGQLALSKANLERAKDRLEWTRRMLDKGYAPISQATNEEFGVSQLEFGLKTSESALRMFEEWSAPKYLRILDADVFMAQSVFDYQTSRLAMSEERLRHYQKQVENCTIKAPHDGFLIYYTYAEYPTYRIKEGTNIQQKQKLFYLPNLARLEVAAPLHETVVKYVHPGMNAKVEVESLPGLLLEGQVESIAEMPTQHWFSDVKSYVGTIKLKEVPEGLRPGMSASVELSVRKPGALVVPSEALSVEEGQEVCYVASEGGLRRREVKSGQATRDLVEITDGLEEGESVVLRPAKARVDPSLVAQADQAQPAALIR